jgi:hypothetical protein
MFVVTRTEGIVKKKKKKKILHEALENWNRKPSVINSEHINQAYPTVWFSPAVAVTNFMRALETADYFSQAHYVWYFIRRALPLGRCHRCSRRYSLSLSLCGYVTFWFS